MKPFNQLFGENAGKPITVDGVTIHIAYRIAPKGKTKIEWSFDTPHPEGMVALKFKAIRSSFHTNDSQKATEFLAIHGQDNVGSLIVEKIGKNPVITITNAYRTEDRNPDWMTYFGNQGLLLEQENSDYVTFRANNGNTNNRMSFSDLTGALRITSLAEPAGTLDTLPVHPAYPLDRYCFIKTSTEGESESDLISKAITLTGLVSDETSHFNDLKNRFADTSTCVIAEDERAVTIEIDLSSEVTSDFAMWDEARSQGLALVRIGDKKLLYAPK
ncbi:hypothetical protein [Corynebacterium sp. ACRPH]|uniref:hypothetical protein n=1 Tax=Corynebacterium sp. ACRPH TaxID=2918199 RepID=UPI001EF1D160|nr:hypothetical protein [Corynebacterium sp. ACRPH]MCG7457582.1 hypothetical protein [Corynebacterium sp. ACRPH]